MTEADTAHHTLVLQGVYQVNVEHARDLRVKYGKPIRINLLLVVGQTLKIKLCKCVAYTAKLLSWMTCGWVADLRRLCGLTSRIWVWHLLIQLRRGWTSRSPIEDTLLARTW